MEERISMEARDLDFGRRLTSLPYSIAINDRENLKSPRLHKCVDAGEAYGASYLITREHLLFQFTGYNLSRVNCEMGSFIMMNQNTLEAAQEENGTVIQTLDVLDFSVVHLSAYERSMRRYFHKTRMKEFSLNNLDLVAQSTKILQDSFAFRLERALATDELKLKKTVAIMPFLGSDMGAGHSKLSNRLVYLKSCFWSIYPIFPSVVVVVGSLQDLYLVR